MAVEVLLINLAQAAIHLPAEQDCPARQALAQEPQFLPSAIKLTHLPEQRVSPLGHLQAPAWQVWPPEHLVPQVPQFPLSFWVSAQTAPHLVVPEGQEHLEALQASPPVQALLQAEQLLALESSFTQIPKQQVEPDAQVALQVSARTFAR